MPKPVDVGTGVKVGDGAGVEVGAVGVKVAVGEGVCVAGGSVEVAEGVWVETS